MTKLGSIGDPMSELEIRRRLNFLKEANTDSGGVVFLPKWMVEADPALQRAVEELDWLKVQGETE